MHTRQHTRKTRPEVSRVADDREALRHKRLCEVHDHWQRRCGELTYKQTTGSARCAPERLLVSIIRAPTNGRQLPGVLLPDRMMQSFNASARVQAHLKDGRGSQPGSW